MAPSVSYPTFEYDQCVPGANPVIQLRKSYTADKPVDRPPSGSPLVCVKRSCEVIGRQRVCIENHGRYAVTGRCGSNRPASRSSSNAVAVIDLLSEPMPKRVCSVTGDF